MENPSHSVTRMILQKRCTSACVQFFLQPTRSLQVCIGRGAMLENRGWQTMDEFPRESMKLLMQPMQSYKRNLN